LGNYLDEGDMEALEDPSIAEAREWIWGWKLGGPASLRMGIVRCLASVSSDAFPLMFLNFCFNFYPRMLVF
jgi:hypothetical protein